MCFEVCCYCYFFCFPCALDFFFFSYYIILFFLFISSFCCIFVCFFVSVLHFITIAAKIEYRYIEKSAEKGEKKEKKTYQLHKNRASMQQNYSKNNNNNNDDDFQYSNQRMCNNIEQMGKKIRRRVREKKRYSNDVHYMH